MKRILILEADEVYATRLFIALVTGNDVVVSQASSLQEAALLLAEEAQDLAFIPLDGAMTIIASMRAKQPDLPLVVLVPDGEARLPEPVEEQVQGTLVKSRLFDELPELLESVKRQREAGAPSRKRKVRDEDRSLAVALQAIPLGDNVLTAVVSRHGQLLAQSGTLDSTQGAAVAEVVNRSWKESHTVQMKFVRLAGRTRDVFLYTRPCAQEMLLTLVARPETEAGHLRQQARRIAEQVEGVVADAEDSFEWPVPDGIESSGQDVVSYAILWRPRRPLPDALHAPLREALRQLADDNECNLAFVETTSELVHLVVSCPDGRTSVWAAHLFKTGTEQALQKQFGVSATLWERGYFATSSTSPLKSAELELLIAST